MALQGRHGRSPQEDAFAEYIQSDAFPCLGAKSVVARRRLGHFVADDLTSGRDDAKIASAISQFAMRSHPDETFVSFAVFFPGTARIDEQQFEKALWSRLQGMHDNDIHGWDPAVSSNPASEHFAMSVGGHAFYVVGMHPLASRAARRSPCPALIFNLHRQFDALRADGTYEKMRRLIIERDIAANGSANPMLARHGESSAARQYSGRLVDADWRCPFHPHQR